MKVEWFVGEGLTKKYGSKQVKKYTQWKNLFRFFFFLPARNFLFVASKEIDSTVK